MVFATLENSLITEDMMVPLAANVTREGHLSLRTLSSSVDGQKVQALVDALSRGRFEPALFAGDPIAVNLVWVVAHMTVKPKT